MKSSRLRTLTAVGVILLIAIGFITNFGFGTLSAFGWSDISILCPLGALGTMLASKLFVPRALISLVIAIILIILLGRAFCAWACPVPIVQKIKGLFAKKPASIAKETKPVSNGKAALPAELAKTTDEVETAGSTNSDESTGVAPLSAEEQAALKTSGCKSCAKKRGAIDTRHFVLGGSLLSAAIFGFPVFCLICPIGLSFATILLVIRLFGYGELTWSLILIPALLIVEVLVFRKWCSAFCPLSAFMSLFGKLNRTFKPTINEKTCIETSQGRNCGICAKVCPEGIDPRHPDLSATSWSECTKCRECVDSCPTNSIKMPFLPVRESGTNDGSSSQESGDKKGEGKKSGDKVNVDTKQDRELTV